MRPASPDSSTAVAAIAGAPHAPEWRARLELGFARRGERTRVVHNLHEGPLRLIRELQSEDGLTCHAVIVHPPGGLVAGDRTALSMRLDQGARVLATTPGAQKWYRSDGRTAHADVSMSIAAGAMLEWLPQPAIVFDAAELRQSISVDLAADARTIGWECLVLGRSAMGERFATGSLEQRLTLRRGGRPVWTERLSATAGGRLFDSPLGWNGRTVAASFWIVGAPETVDDELVRILREDLEVRPGCQAGVTRATDGVLIAKILADDSEQAMRAAEGLWSISRPRVLGSLAAPPRIWAT